MNTFEPPAPARDGERDHYPLRPLDLVAIAAFWALLAIISTLSRELDPRIPGIPPRVMSAVVRTTHIEYALWAVITAPLVWLTTRFSIEGGRRLGRVLLFIALGIVVAITMDNLLLSFRELVMPPERFRRRPPPALIGLGFLDDLMVYFTVLGAGIARDYFLRYRAGVETAVRLQAQLAQTRLEALRSQLNPHFLFNTLNAVSALVERDPRGARRMIAGLSQLLRHTLDASAGREVPLQRELDVLDEYIDLMQIRFQDRLDVRISADDAARRALVPSLLLQPIVENAIQHGVANLGGGTIAITAARRGDDLVIVVADTGPGPGGGEAGVGLRNTNERLRTMYGPTYQVVLRGTPGGTEAELRLPFHTEPS